ncbi:hypothetical protein CH361_18500 [Leptospira brenneri]|nr:hypothetical protein CH361_18500 [Leptospira brenneri]
MKCFLESTPAYFLRPGLRFKSFVLLGYKRKGSQRKSFRICERLERRAWSVLKKMVVWVGFDAPLFFIGTWDKKFLYYLLETCKLILTPLTG